MSARFVSAAAAAAAVWGAGATASAVTVADLCKLSLEVKNLGLKRPSTLPAGYEILQKHLFVKSLPIQAIVVRHAASGRVVIAFRGTTTKDDLLADIGIGIDRLGAAFTALRRGLANQTWAFFAALTGKKKRGPVRPYVFKHSGKTAPWDKPLRELGQKVRSHARLRPRIDAATKLVGDVLRTVKKADGSPLPPSMLLLTGHSLGGYLAQLAALKHGTLAHTFNAPGARYDAENIARLVIINHVRESDIVGRIGAHYGTTLVYPDLDMKLKLVARRYLRRNHSARWMCPDLGPIWKDALEKLPGEVVSPSK